MRRILPYIAIPALVLATGCQEQLTANYSTREEASKQCLSQAESWLKEELSEPPYDGTNAGSGFSILKNSRGEYKILDVYCKPLRPRNGVISLVPYVRYMEIPTYDFELHETKDVIAGSKFTDFTFPVDSSSR